MSPHALRATTPRRAGTLAALLLVSVLGAACSDDGPVPACRNCEDWSRVTRVLGRFPAPHPQQPRFVVFSTVEKADSLAIDASRENDEDIWLTWIENENDPDANSIVGRTLFAITDDSFRATGDNTSPVWSPSGTKIAFLHTTSTGGSEIWQMDLTLPAAAGEPPVLGAPALVIADGQDPAWLPGDRLLFARGDKIFLLDLSAGPEKQLSFDPPSYSSTDTYVDRHPSTSLDGETVFDTRNRLSVTNMYLQAFEVTPPDTIPTDAFILFQSPSAGQPTFPVLEGGTELRTPRLLRSIPIESDGAYRLGASLSSTVLADSLRENYCDTTLIVDHLPVADVTDTLSFYFEVVRSTLCVVTEAVNASIFWTRADGRVSMSDFTGSIEPLNVDRCQPQYYDCLLPWFVDQNDSIRVGQPETYLISATTGPGGVQQENLEATLTPGDTTTVIVFDNPDFSCGQPIDGSPAAGPAARASIATTYSGASRVSGAPGSSGSILRAPGDESTLWRLALDEEDRAQFLELVGSDGLIQNPALTEEFDGGVRYAAYVSDEDGNWELFVQRLENWVADGPPFRVETPGTFDNLDCSRNIFHPQFDPDSRPGDLTLYVTMTECPDNEFSDIDFDEDPWPIGELRIWKVTVGGGFQ